MRLAEVQILLEYILPCGHYCHTSCLDYLGKIYSNNMKYYGKYLIYNCKLCNKNIKL